MHEPGYVNQGCLYLVQQLDSEWEHIFTNIFFRRNKKNERYSVKTEVQAYICK